MMTSSYSKMDILYTSNITLLQDLENASLESLNYEEDLTSEESNSSLECVIVNDCNDTSVVANLTLQFQFHPFYENYAEEAMATTSFLLCCLGGLSVVLNVFVITALFKNRRRVLSKNVFYVIVMHCAILDVVRGVCLIVYALPQFANSIYRLNLSISTRITLFRASTFALVFLRICNLLTIFNLLVFTSNEFIVIRYPLHYRRYFRRRAVLFILFLCWVISIILGAGLLIPSSAPASYDSRHYDRSGEWHLDFAALSLLLISLLCFLVLFIVIICYTFILRTIRKFKEENGGKLNNDESYRIHSKSVHRNLHGTGSNGSNTSSRWRGVQAVSRHKYIYVIGSVLLIDILFLCPYSGIQLVAFLHINNIIEISHGSTLIRWWLQVLIGVHSVCQPLCYFRMNEFRRLACCIGRSSFNRTKSLSQLNRSFANTRSNLNDIELDQNETVEQPLLTEGDANSSRSERHSPVLSISTIQNNSLNLNRTESVRFRTYQGENYAQREFVECDDTDRNGIEMTYLNDRRQSDSLLQS
ncbi:hypothetical protein WR25_01557 [Diploscapter pachys]|uniref:G-protein coupled receptors family 1 profile domain-containing protein n=1 Tax=Diploscapter pachys TaxID=2018661 RepID=A0A2A2K5N9_9BILA|nr:hypothetical protein WR25_01557 [Diploscapter pachys]